MIQPLFVGYGLNSFSIDCYFVQFRPFYHGLHLLRLKTVGNFKMIGGGESGIFIKIRPHINDVGFVLHGYRPGVVPTATVRFKAIQFIC